MPAIKSVWETKCYRDCVKEYLDDKMNTCYREHIGDEWNMCYRYLWERTYVIKGIPTYWRCVLWEDFVRWYEPTESVMWKREREREREKERFASNVVFWSTYICLCNFYLVDNERGHRTNKLLSGERGKYFNSWFILKNQFLCSFCYWCLCWVALFSKFSTWIILRINLF